MFRRVNIHMISKIKIGSKKNKTQCYDDEDFIQRGLSIQCKRTCAVLAIITVMVVFLIMSLCTQ